MAMDENQKKYLTNMANGKDSYGNSVSEGQKAWAKAELAKAGVSTSSSNASSSSSSNKTSSSSGNKSSSSSNKTSSSSNKSSSSGGYTAKGTYKDAGITGSDKDLLTQYGNQYNAAKAAGDQAGMDAAHAAAEALRAKYGYSGGSDGSDYIYTGLPSYDEEDYYDYEDYYEERPIYEDKYNALIDEYLNKYLNRDSFSYDVNSDPLYEQYKAQYLREGNRAMNDAMASAAANAGGMNSYAMTAAQQANNYYNAQLTDKIPELYQLAYGMYLDDIDQQIQDLNIIQDMDATQYNRYRDTMADWRDDQNFLYDMYKDNRDYAYGVNRDNISDLRYNTEWDYAVGRDAIADERYENEWDYAVGRDDISDSRYDNETAYNQAMMFLEMGVMPSSDVLAKAGISSSEAQAYINRVKQKEKSTDGSGRTGKTGDDTGTGDGTRDPKTGTPVVEDGEDDIDWASVTALGYGPIGEEQLDQLMSSGEVIGEWGEDGKLHFRKANTPFGTLGFGI